MAVELKDYTSGQLRLSSILGAYSPVSGNDVAWVEGVEAQMLLLKVMTEPQEVIDDVRQRADLFGVEFNGPGFAPPFNTFTAVQFVGHVYSTESKIIAGVRQRQRQEGERTASLLQQLQREHQFLSEVLPQLGQYEQSVRAVEVFQEQYDDAAQRADNTEAEYVRNLATAIAQNTASAERLEKQLRKRFGIENDDDVALPTVEQVEARIAEIGDLNAQPRDPSLIGRARERIEEIQSNITVLDIEYEALMVVQDRFKSDVMASGTRIEPNPNRDNLTAVEITEGFTSDVQSVVLATSHDPASRRGYIHPFDDVTDPLLTTAYNFEEIVDGLLIQQSAYIAQRNYHPRFEQKRRDVSDHNRAVNDILTEDRAAAGHTGAVTQLSEDVIGYTEPRHGATVFNDYITAQDRILTVHHVERSLGIHLEMARVRGVELQNRLEAVREGYAEYQAEKVLQDWLDKAVAEGLLTAPRATELRNEVIDPYIALQGDFDQTLANRVLGSLGIDHTSYETEDPAAWQVLLAAHGGDEGRAREAWSQQKLQEFVTTFEIPNGGGSLLSAINASARTRQAPPPVPAAFDEAEEVLTDLTAIAELSEKALAVQTALAVLNLQGAEQDQLLEHYEELVTELLDVRDRVFGDPVEEEALDRIYATLTVLDSHAQLAPSAFEVYHQMLECIGRYELAADQLAPNLAAYRLTENGRLLMSGRIHDDTGADISFRSIVYATLDPQRDVFKVDTQQADLRQWGYGAEVAALVGGQLGRFQQRAGVRVNAGDVAIDSAVTDAIPHTQQWVAVEKLEMLVDHHLAPSEVQAFTGLLTQGGLLEAANLFNGSPNAWEQLFAVAQNVTDMSHMNRQRNVMHHAFEGLFHALEANRLYDGSAVPPTLVTDAADIARALNGATQAGRADLGAAVLRFSTPQVRQAMTDLLAIVPAMKSLEAGLPEVAPDVAFTAPDVDAVLAITTSFSERAAAVGGAYLDRLDVQWQAANNEAARKSRAPYIGVKLELDTELQGISAVTGVAADRKRRPGYGVVDTPSREAVQIRDAIDTEVDRALAGKVQQVERQIDTAEDGIKARRVLGIKGTGAVFSGLLTAQRGLGTGAGATTEAVNLVASQREQVRLGGVVANVDGVFTTTEEAVGEVLHAPVPFKNAAVVAGEAVRATDPKYLGIFSPNGHGVTP